MSERYQIARADANLSSKELATFLAKDGQLLLPMLDLVIKQRCFCKSRRGSWSFIRFRC